MWTSSPCRHVKAVLHVHTITFTLVLRYGRRVDEFDANRIYWGVSLRHYLNRRDSGVVGDRHELQQQLALRIRLQS